jgi:hypothetical protein
MPSVAVVKQSTPRVRFLWRVYVRTNPARFADGVVATSAYGAIAEGSNRLGVPTDELEADLMRGAPPKGSC